MSTLGCKEDDPAPNPTPTPTAGYTINNQNIKCTATGVPTINNGADVLILTLTTTPQPASGPEVFTITYLQSASNPISTYNPNSSSRTETTAAGTTATTYGTTVGAIQSGTTSAKVGGKFATYLTIPPGTAIMGGFFTDIPY